jgi:DNA-binding beta-propeller fold protein YncE
MQWGAPKAGLLTAIVFAALASLALGGVEPASNGRGAIRPGGVDYLRTIDSSAIKEFSAPRSFWGKLFEWVAGPSARPFFGRPYDLTEDTQGRLLVTDPALRLVHILDFERRRYDALTGSKRVPFISPIGIAVDTSDNIYVADSARACIYVFDKKGKFLRYLGRDRDDMNLKRPTGLAVDSEHGLLYIADTLRHQVLVFTLEGDPVKIIGHRGAGQGEFNFPAALTFAKGSLYVVDTMNFRIQVFTREGNFLDSYGQLSEQEHRFNRPKGIAVDTEGKVYVVDALLENVQVFDPKGRILLYFGSSGRMEGQFQLPSGIHVTSRDQIYITDSYNQRVQVFHARHRKP